MAKAKGQTTKTHEPMADIDELAFALADDLLFEDFDLAIVIADVEDFDFKTEINC
jgi:hypothetical protein